MEILVILLFIILVILIVSFRNRTLERMDQLQKEIVRLQERLEIKETFRAAESPRAVRPPEPVRAPETARPPETGKSPETAKSPDMATPSETEPFTPPIPKKPIPQPEAQPSRDVQPAREITEPHVFQSSAGATQSSTGGTQSSAGATQSSPSRENPHRPLPPAETPGFFERHPDLEKFIGENLVSKIGIGILVLAIGFFVKYAIDNDWIGAVGRVGIGILCGGILIGIAHFLRNSYKAFSSVLVGGGLAVFYFSIALAYHEYQLFSQPVAFIIMLVITAFAVILSLLYDRQELAIIALVGGFVTPFLVSNGSGNYKVLFSYLLILNTGLLVMAYRKAWRLLNLLAFGFTAILFSSWLATLPGNTVAATFKGAFLFATAFYILFFFINIAHNIRENKQFIASDFGILLVNTCLYSAAGLYLLTVMGAADYKGLFSACMAVFNLSISYFLFRKKKVDTNVLYLLIGITLTFISLTAPIQLRGHYITLFWASESVLLYWLSRKSGIRIFKWAAYIVWVATLVSLLLDWVNVYLPFIRKGRFPIIFNKALMTTLYTAACCYILFRLHKKVAFIVVTCLLLLIGGALEIQYQFDWSYPGTQLSTLYLLLYGFAWVYGITYADYRWRWFGDAIFGMGLLLLSLFAYLICIPQVYAIQTNLLPQGLSAHFLAHWATAALAGMMIYRSVSWWRKDRLKAISPAAFSWLICIVIVIFLSAEVQLLVNAAFYSNTLSFDRIRTIYIKTGLPILWGVCSFVFMWMGMQHKFKPLRIVSLVLFSVTLLKLFLYDIQDIPVAGKIAAFFCLGVLLLVVSFMYQRLKKIIIEDEEKKTF